MSVWDVYLERTHARGTTKRGAVLKREIRTIEQHLPDNLSYQKVRIFNPECGYNISSPEMEQRAILQNAAVINSDNLNEKTILTMPGEDIRHGALVEWMDNYWLVTERDANTTVYTRAKMLQCNHLLRWVSEEHKICEQWCIVEDGTKYLTGEYEDRNFIVTRGDSRIYLMIGRNAETVRLGRKNRFLIDDEDSPQPLAYLLTKPLKKGWSYNKDGVFKFVLQEVVVTKDDNVQLRIADYYKHFPDGILVDHDDGSLINPDNISEETGKRVWL